jgi:hypothetical protein
MDPIKEAVQQEILSIRDKIRPDLERIKKLESMLEILAGIDSKKSEDALKRLEASAKPVRRGTVKYMVLRIVDAHYPINTAGIQEKGRKMYKRRLRKNSVHGALSILCKDKLIERVRKGWYAPLRKATKVK